MKKFFVIGVAGLTAAQDQQFVEALKPNCGWWHNVDGTWLVFDPTGVETVDTFRKKIQNINEMATSVVLEVRPVTWTTRLRNNETGSPKVTWMQNHWTE